jgi:hypothetical protein
MIFKNLYRHYNVVHNQTYRKQEKQKTGPKKKKIMKRTTTKKRGLLRKYLNYLSFFHRKVLFGLKKISLIQFIRQPTFIIHLKQFITTIQIRLFDGKTRDNSNISSIN